MCLFSYSYQIELYLKSYLWYNYICILQAWNRIKVSPGKMREVMFFMGFEIVIPLSSDFRSWEVLGTKYWSKKVNIAQKYLKQQTYSNQHWAPGIF